LIYLTIQNERADDLAAISDWQVSTDHSASDHRCDGGYSLAEQKKARNYKKAKWDVFREILSRYNLDVDECIDVMASNLEEAINEALETACPMRPLLPFKPNKWWTKEVTRARKAYQLAFKQRNKNIQSYIACKETKRTYQRLITHKTCKGDIMARVQLKKQNPPKTQTTRAKQCATSIAAL